MKHFYALLLIAILLPSLAMAGGYEYQITKIGESDVGNGKIHLSADGKFIYVCNTNGNFAKFDIEKGAVVDTFSIPNEAGISLANIIVDRTGKYLIQEVYYEDNVDSVFTYDLTQRKKIGSTSFSSTIVGQYDYCASSYYGFDYSPNDSVLAISVVGYGTRGNGYVTSGGLCFYNFLSNKFEISSIIEDHAVAQLHYSKDFKRLIVFGYYYSSGRSQNTFVSSTSSGFSIYDNNIYINGAGFYQYRSSESGEVTSEGGERMTSMAVDNTCNQIFSTADDGIFRVYSIKDSSYIFAEKKALLTNSFLFPPSDYYYFGYSADGTIFVFSKQYHLLIDTIQTNIAIRNAHISPDSTSIYVLDVLGGLYNIAYELMDNEKKIGLNTLTKQIQLGDTIKIYDLSIGDFQSRKWTINGIEIADSSRVINFLPETKGLYTVQLECTSGDSTYLKKETNLFRVFERTTANYNFSSDDFKDSIGVNFVNSSKGEELKFVWYFGDSTSSIEANPYHYYTKKGIYFVTLIAYNDFFADTLITAKPVEYGSNSLLGITLKTNRTKTTTVTDKETLNSISKATIYGSNGFKKNDSFGFTISVVILDSRPEMNEQLYSALRKGFVFLGSLNNNSTITTRELYKDWEEMPYYYHIETFPIPAQSQFIDENKFYYSIFGTYRNNCPLVSTFDIDSNKISEIHYHCSSASINSIHSLLTKDETLSVFHSDLIRKTNLDSATMLININISTKQQDTSYSDKQFFYSIPDNDNGIISLIAKENTKFQVYSYTLSAGLVPQFSLSNIDTILFADRNIEKEKYLFISRKIQGTDSLLNLTITNKDGNIINSDTLNNIKKITDIKFTKDLILITPVGNPRLIIYDLNGNFISEYSDNYINGELNDITYLNNNKALLVGTKYSINSNIIGEIPSQSELYYVVDLGKVDTVIKEIPGKIEFSKILCYPNPANSDIRFDFANNENELARLTIIDPMGNEIANLQTIEDFATFPTERLAIGVYFVRGTIGSQTLTGKFVVAR